MLIQEKAGHINSFEIENRSIDILNIEWFETGKRILRKKTVNGIEVSLKFLDERPQLTEGDILYADENFVIIISIIPCDCIVIHPVNMLEAGAICYEIGNRHLPLFYQDEKLLVPFDAPIFNWLKIQSLNMSEAKEKLLHPFKTTIAPHNISIGNDVFSTIKA